MMPKWLTLARRAVHPLATVVALALALTGNPQCAAVIAEAALAANPTVPVVVVPSGS